MRNLTEEEEGLMEILLLVALSVLPLLTAFGLPVPGVAVMVTDSLGCVFGVYLLEDYLRNGLVFCWFCF